MVYYRLFNHHSGPAVLVFNLAVLDAAQRVEELFRYGAGLVAEGVALAGIEVVYIRNR